MSKIPSRIKVCIVKLLLYTSVLIGSVLLMASVYGLLFVGRPLVRVDTFVLLGGGLLLFVIPFVVSYRRVK